MLEEIAGLGFRRVELSHGIKLNLVEGIEHALQDGVVEVSSMHNFCPLPNGIQQAAPNVYHQVQRAIVSLICGSGIRSDPNLRKIGRTRYYLAFRKCTLFLEFTEEPIKALDCTFKLAFTELSADPIFQKNAKRQSVAYSEPFVN